MPCCERAGRRGRPQESSFCSKNASGSLMIKVSRRSRTSSGEGSGRVNASGGNNDTVTYRCEITPPAVFFRFSQVSNNFEPFEHDFGPNWSVQRNREVEVFLCYIKGKNSALVFRVICGLRKAMQTFSYSSTFSTIYAAVAYNSVSGWRTTNFLLGRKPPHHSLYFRRGNGRNGGNSGGSLA